MEIIDKHKNTEDEMYACEKVVPSKAHQPMQKYKIFDIYIKFLKKKIEKEERKREILIVFFFCSIAHASSAEFSNIIFS